ncbi:hypothetical protein D3C72_1237790 [compost metagenome]
MLCINVENFILAFDHHITCRIFRKRYAIKLIDVFMLCIHRIALMPGQLPDLFEQRIVTAVMNRSLGVIAYFIIKSTHPYTIVLVYKQPGYFIGRQTILCSIRFESRAVEAAYSRCRSNP